MICIYLEKKPETECFSCLNTKRVNTRFVVLEFVSLFLNHLALKVFYFNVCVASMCWLQWKLCWCCVTFTACQGSLTTARSKRTCQSKDVLGNNLKHYLRVWQLPLQWTMTSPKLCPLSIYLQQCGTSHIKAVCLVLRVSLTACS